MTIRDSAGTTTGFRYIGRAEAAALYACHGWTEAQLTGLEKLEPASVALPNGSRLFVSSRPLYEPF